MTALEHDHAVHEALTKFARIEGVLERQDRDITGLFQAVKDCNTNIETSHAKTMAEIRELGRKFDGYGKINWQMVGVFLSAIGLLGGVLFFAINRPTAVVNDRQDDTIKSIRDDLKEEAHRRHERELETAERMGFLRAKIGQ